MSATTILLPGLSVTVDERPGGERFTTIRRTDGKPVTAQDLDAVDAALNEDEDGDGALQ